MASNRPADLFEAAARAELLARGPLASRLRPQRLDEVVGQTHLLAKDATLRQLIEADRLSSAIFFGPPGTGKTTVAQLAARTSRKAFVELSATSAGIRDVRGALEEAQRRLGEFGQGTIVFIDEIHRFSRTQQDALLPGVEEGVITLIGATTENPFFSLTAPLLSRSSLWRFEVLSDAELATLLRRAAELEGASIDEDAILSCCRLAEGSARAALASLEVALVVAKTTTNGRVTKEAIDASRTTRSLRHGADEHYDVLSVFIKSLRGSDPDAGLYWLARLLAAGEDPRLIARRLVILASEDIGMADPSALLVADAAASAVERVGLPEVGLNLAHAVVHLACAPKSNRSTRAWFDAQRDVAQGPRGEVPPVFRDASYQGAQRLGHGVGYEYPHDDPSKTAVSYLPEVLAGRRYYEPSNNGLEADLAARWKSAKESSETDTSETTEKTW